MTWDPRLKDKWWRLTHLYKIKDKEGQLITFYPNETQLRHLAERGTVLRQRILKYRQGGFTTLYAIDYLDDALWNPGYSAAILAHERETLDKIFYIIKRAYENMPDSIKPTTRQDTLRAYKFEKAYDGRPLDSEIYVAMKLRGGTVQALHISERAYIEGEDSQELEAGSKQAVPISGRISEETTANGMNEFYDGFMSGWKKKDQGELEYRSFFYAWHEHTEYTLPGMIDVYTEADEEVKAIVREAYKKELTDGQLLWYRWKVDELKNSQREDGYSIGLNARQLMKQEYPSTVSEAFQSGMGNVFDLVKLEKLQAKEPILVTKSGIQIWKKPEKGGEYVLGADPSSGGSLDRTAIDIWDRKTKEQVAQWVGMISADQAADIARIMAELYLGAFAGIENNTQSMILFFAKIYDHFYSVIVEDERTKRRERKIGFNTNTKTRDPLIDGFIEQFEEGGLIINSAHTIKEMKTFVMKENGKREHADGKHDDALFAGMIAVKMFNHYRPRGTMLGGGNVKIKTLSNPFELKPQPITMNAQGELQSPDFWEKIRTGTRKKGSIE